MANRYPGHGYQPHRGIDSRGIQNRGCGMSTRGRGMPNRNVPNRDMSNQGFLQNENMSNRGTPLGQGLNTYEGYQPNQVMSNSGMSRAGLNLNQSIQTNQIPDRTQPSLPVNTNQGFQGNMLPNRAMSNPGMNQDLGYQNRQNRDNNDSGFNNNQGYPTNKNPSNSNRGYLSSEIDTKIGPQTSQSYPNRGQTLPDRELSNTRMSTNQSFHPNRGMSKRNMSYSGLGTGQGFQNFPSREFANPRMNTNEGIRAAHRLPYTDMSNNGINTNQGFNQPQRLSDRGMSNPGISVNQGFYANQSFSNTSISNPGRNTNQGLNLHQDLSERGISNLGSNANQDYQANTSLPNKGITGYGISSNQDFQRNQNMSDRGPNRGMNVNQGFQTNQDMPERGIPNQRVNSHKGFQRNQNMSDRGPNSGINVNQGFQTNQDMSERGIPNQRVNSHKGFQTNQDMSDRGPNGGINVNQGFQTNQDMPERGIPNQRVNSHKGFQTNQDMSDRGIPNSRINSNQGFQTNWSMSDRGIPNARINVNQGYQTNQSMSDRGIHNRGINANQGFQTNQDMSDRGMSYRGINADQGFQANPDMLNREMSNPRMNPSQTNQNIDSNREEPFPVNYNSPMINQQVNSQQTSQGNFNMPNEKPVSLQMNDKFPLHSDAQFERNSQGQMGSFCMQQGSCTLPHNTMAQSPIIQHVMIPVPVPVGTDIPPHLLRPQIITSTGPMVSNPNQHTGSQIPGIQHQGQINPPGQFPVVQGQFQGQSQPISMPDQRNMSGNPVQGSFHAPNKDTQASSYSVNDLSYYIGKESRNVKRDSSMDNLDSSVESDSRNNCPQVVHEEIYEKRHSHKEDERCGPHNKFQLRHEDSERERIKSENFKSQNSSIYSSFAPKYFERSGHEVSRKFSDPQMNHKGHVDSYRKHDDYDVKNKDISNSGKFENIGRNVEFESQNRIEREHKTEQQKEYTAEMNYDLDRNRRYDSQANEHSSDTFRDIQNKQDSNELRGKQRAERHSGAVLYTDGNLEESDKVKNSSAILYTDGNREDLNSRGVEQYERDKRKYSPVTEEVSSKKQKRVYSPVSDSKGHGELKIHVSDSGRWIEGDSNLSPISDAYDVDKYDKADMDDVHTKEIKYDQASLDGAEMVSDSESYIGDMSDINVRVNVREQSPLSQHSSRYESSRVSNQGEERVSPSRSNYSKYSEEKRSQSYRSKHSDDLQQDKIKISGKGDASGHLIDLKGQHLGDRQKTNFRLIVPDLCRYFNLKGCYRENCVGLHVCRFFIIDQCKFGEHCSKGHDVFYSQSHDVLSKFNPGIRGSNATAEEIKKVLKDRILSNTPASRLSHNTSKALSPVREPVNEVVAADPSFDARNYATGNIVDAREKINKNKNELNLNKGKTEQSETKVETKKGNATSNKVKSEKKRKKNGSSESKSKLNDKKDLERNDKKIKKKNTKQKQTSESINENMLSPVSGDEDDWDKYEKYEQVSDDGMSVTEDGLDNVSSDESSIEQVQVNRSVSSFPLPTAENIAVPIGMDDPLVFNRPLKNNPQSYIGPMNRPPPMFPLTGENNTPLFPVIPQNQPGFTGIPVPGQLPNIPNHLPSPDFMKQVIKSLPQFKIEPIEGKNVFKNDNNPVSSELEPPKKKIKTDKAEKEPELKETIKKLWKFPHKGVINMSIIEFVTETEAYREEFIAEIVKILVTLELPYVTMKKLLSVIKEKVSINVKSEADMRKILEMYPNNFKMIEMVDSDDESDDSETKKNVQIKANIGVGFCEKHGFLPFAIGKCECSALHLCKFYFLSDCPVKLCKFGHKLKTDHNIAVLKQHKLHRLTGEEILNYLADTDNRNKGMIPNICKYYIREKGCYKGDNTDFETICHSLHLCAYILKGKCMNRECDRSHSIHDKQPLSLLKKYGLDPEVLGDEKVLLMLGEKCIENDKGKRVSSVKQNQGTKSITNKSTDKGKDNRTSKVGSEKIAGEGLTIITHSETRVSSKYFVQNFKVPAVCKFYQNALGCRKKDWGAAGKCFFLHVCQHYVTGDCSFGDKCKRSHDLFSGQAAEILEKYNFDLDNLSASEILRRLNSNSGAPVELPTSGKSFNVDNENTEITIDSVGEPDEVDMSNFEISKHAMEIETSTDEEKIESSSKKVKRSSESSKQKEADRKKTKSKSTSFASGNVEDVIKHIMEHNKVDKK